MGSDPDDRTDAEYLLALARSRPRRDRWQAIVETIDELTEVDPDTYQALEPELCAALESWPDDLRVCPDHWWAVVQDDKLPWGWEVARTLIPTECSELLNDDIYAHITRLDLTRFPCVHGSSVMYGELELFTGLVSLDISHTGSMYFDYVSGLPHLREIIAYGCYDIMEFTALHHTNLTHLSVSPTHVENALDIARITTLESLHISRGVWTETLEPLHTLPRLQALQLNDFLHR